MPARSGLLSRRIFLGGAAASAWLLGAARPGLASQSAGDGFRVLRAKPGASARLRGPDAARTAVWSYEGSVPGPLLRVRQGDQLNVRLVNDLPQPSVIHWHGLRLPNAMDGVPHLTQMPVEPGRSFDYSFAPPDAGTFWYHSHLHSSEQLARGLYGVLIVDEREPVAVDRELVLVVDDWRLDDGGSIHAASFGSFFDAAHAGRLGQYITLNSEDRLDIGVTANERIRLRIVNTANARIFTLRFAKHRPQVIARDGQPAKPGTINNGSVTLGPGNRVDLILDAALAPGSRASILVDDLRGGELELGRIVYDAGAPKRPQPLAEAIVLPANPLPDPRPDGSAMVVDVPLDGGAMAMMMGGGMGGGMMGGREFSGQGVAPSARIWALAGIAATGHDGRPLFRIKRGQTVVLNFENRTAFAHAMHVHGHHFRVLDGRSSGWRPYWLDTTLVDIRSTQSVAFIADNPGKWMLHCHMLEHQEAGMAAWFEVD